MPPEPDIICAPATPEGVGALAVVRVSGEGSSALVERLLSLEPGRLAGMRRKVALLTDGGRPVDRIVAVSWPRGASYTGEEMVEITSHGLPSIVARILDLLRRSGARSAEPGEFTRRALAAGRLSALDVLALAGMLRGEGRAQELTGRLGDECGRLLAEIRRCRDALEGDLEFGDPNPDAGCEDASAGILRAAGAARALRELAGALEGTSRVVLMGPVNSGKSTLFNRLTGAGALVSPEPGTTRDGASREVFLRGRRILLCDSAGIGGGRLDAAAAEAAVGSLGPRDRVVWMSDGGAEPVPDALRAVAWEIVEVSGRSDLVRETGEDRLRVSSVTGEGIEILVGRIAAAPGSSSVSALGERVEAAVDLAGTAIAEGDLPLAAVHLQDAEDAVAGILGRGDAMELSIERALEGLCVGK